MIHRDLFVLHATAPPFSCNSSTPSDYWKQLLVSPLLYSSTRSAGKFRHNHVYFEDVTLVWKQQQAMMQRLATSNVNHCHEFSTCKSYKAYKFQSSTRNMFLGELDQIYPSCCLVATFRHKCSLNNWISWSPLYELKLSGWLCQRCSLNILKLRSFNQNNDGRSGEVLRARWTSCATKVLE